MSDTADPLAGARAAFERHEWSRACDGFRAADASGPLTADDWSALAESQWWLGGIDEALAGWARAYELYIDSDHPLRAAMSAMYLGIHALERGDSALGTGWMRRCRRLLARRRDHRRLLASGPSRRPALVTTREIELVDFGIADRIVPD